MGLMASFERGMERFLVPVAIKLNSQKHVAAVRDGFVFTFPIIMASSLIILINFAILSPDGFIAGLLHLISSGCWGSTDLIQRRQFEKPFFLRLIWRISPGPLNTALPGARHIRLPGLLLMMHSPTAAVQV